MIYQVSIGPHCKQADSGGFKNSVLPTAVRAMAASHHTVCKQLFRSA